VTLPLDSGKVKPLMGNFEARDKHINSPVLPASLPHSSARPRPVHCYPSAAITIPMQMISLAI